MAEIAFRVGDTVWGNAQHAAGLPYRATVEALKDGRAKIRPLAGEHVLTAGEAKSTRSGPSVRARWVDARWLKPIKSRVRLPGHP